MEVLEIARASAWTDEQVIERVLAGETALYEIIMRRYNQRLYRVVRAILRDDNEAEDVIQDAYVRAYQSLAQFENRSAFSTWLIRIAMHEALARVRRRNRFSVLDEEDDSVEGRAPSREPDPEQTLSQSELRRVLEDSILQLPARYRTVVMLRDIEEMSTAETAAALGISEQNVKVRLHRAHVLARKMLLSRVGSCAKSAFPFMNARCDRVVAGVFARLGI
jgi:RNA polymerase sigma-70 factor (ECF subfamily)